MTKITYSVFVLFFFLSTPFFLKAQDLTVDLTSRSSVRTFYNQTFKASDDVSSNWNGNVSQGDAGSISSAYKDAIVLRINWFRAMAGLPADVTLKSEWNNKCKKMALMMSANTNISHSPDTSWKFYTADGAEAASKSNLSLGTGGPYSIFSLMRDNGDNNKACGHRRWLLFPLAKVMGVGTIPPDGYPTMPSLCNWVLGSSSDGSWAPEYPETPEYVAWPPAGYVPDPVVFPRWSFSLRGADFDNACVTMTKNGRALSAQVYKPTYHYGDNTLVWVPGDQTVSATFLGEGGDFRGLADEDITYGVTISNVVVLGETKKYNYQVIAFDPSTKGTAPPTEAPVITSRTSKRGRRGIAFRYKIKANNSPTSYALTGTLPKGFRFRKKKGLIKGTPREKGTFQVELTATNSIGTSDPVTLTIKIKKKKRTS